MLDHYFGDEPGEHSLSVAARVRLTLPDLEHFYAMQYACKLDDADALVSAITGRVLPTLEELSSVDALLDQ